MKDDLAKILRDDLVSESIEIKASGEKVKGVLDLRTNDKAYGSRPMRGKQYVFVCSDFLAFPLKEGVVCIIRGEEYTIEEQIVDAQGMAMIVFEQESY